MKVKNIELPFFYGFYESPYADVAYISDVEIDAIKHLAKSEEDCKNFMFNFERYSAMIGGLFSESFSDYLPDWVSSVEFTSIWRPKYYNYESDKVVTELTLSEDWEEKLNGFMSKNEEWLTSKIKEEWTSRDGFFSLICSDYDKFCERLFSMDGRYISIMLKYAILRLQGKDEADLEEKICEDTMKRFYKEHSEYEFVERLDQKN